MTNAGDCSWSSPTFTICGTTYLFTLIYSAGSTVLELHEPATSPSGSWFGGGCPTSGLSLSGGGLGSCNTWPANVTIN